MSESKKSYKNCNYKDSNHRTRAILKHNLKKMSREDLEQYCLSAVMTARSLTECIHSMEEIISAQEKLSAAKDHARDIYYKADVECDNLEDLELMIYGKIYDAEQEDATKDSEIKVEDLNNEE